MQVRQFLGRAGVSLLLIASSAAMALSASAQAPKTVDVGLEATAKTAFGQLPAQRELPVIIGNVIRSALTLVGLLFMLLVVYGGFLWMTARGNEQQVEKAKNILTSAIVGMLIIGAGYAITSFVLQAVQTTTTGQT